MNAGGDVRSLLEAMGGELSYHELRADARDQEAVWRWPLLRVTVATLADFRLQSGDVTGALLLRGQAPARDGINE